MHLEALGDQAVIAYCADEKDALALRVSAAEPASRGSLTLCKRTRRSPCSTTSVTSISLRPPKRFMRSHPTAPRMHRGVACMSCRAATSLGLDLPRIAAHTGRSVEEVIALHAATRYTVYAIGFCPGFPYLGYLPEALAGVPRLPSPRLRVEAGSVGLTGRQTGIYTEERPGGWNLVGRTPLELVNVADGYFPLATGDQVQFQRIGTEEYQRRQGERLADA